MTGKVIAISLGFQGFPGAVGTLVSNRDLTQNMTITFLNIHSLSFFLFSGFFFSMTRF